jgi:predicted transcriptional regulator
MARKPAPKRKAPAKAVGPFTMSLRLPPELATELAAIARAEGRSRTKQIEAALRQFVQSYRGKAAA